MPGRPRLVMAPGWSEVAASVRVAEPDAQERPVAPVPDAAVWEALVAQAAGKSTPQMREMLAKVDPDLARPADRMRPLGAGRWERKAVINDDCQVGLEQLNGLLSHVAPRVVREALDRHDPSRPPGGRGRRRTPDGAEQTSAPKTAGGPDATAAQQTGMPAGSATSGGTTCRRTPATVGHPDRGGCHGGDFGAEGGPSCWRARRLHQRRFMQRTGPRQAQESPLRRRR